MEKKSRMGSRPILPLDACRRKVLRHRPYLDHFGDFTEMVGDSVTAAATSGFRLLYHLLEIAMIRVPEDLGEVTAARGKREGF